MCIQKTDFTGITGKYTLKLNSEKLGRLLTGFIIVYMKTADHNNFQSFLKHQESVIEAHRINGDGCYIIKVNTSGNVELKQFLDLLLKYANYRLLISIGRIKG